MPADAVTSLSVLAAVPFVLGYLTSRALRRASLLTSLFAPWGVLALLLGIARSGGWVHPLLVAFALPWLLVASASGGVTAWRTRSHPRQAVTLAVVLALIITALGDALATPPVMTKEVAVSIDVAAPPEVVWEFALRVDSIAPATREGLLARILPAPVMVQLDHARKGGVRRVVFESGMMFASRITEWSDPEVLGYSVRADSVPMRARTIGLTRDRLAIVDGRHELEPSGDSATRILMATTYRSATHVNWYVAWWADRVIQRLQQSLLQVMKDRSEAAVRSRVPYLTAEMLELEAALLAHAEALATGSRRRGAAAAILTGRYETEVLTDPATSEVGTSPDELSRELLRRHAPRARATGLLRASAPSGSAGDMTLLTFEFEDRQNRCVTVQRHARGTASRPALGARVIERCEIRALAEVNRRGHRLARLPFRVDAMDVVFTTVGDYPGSIDIYRDSVVVMVRNGRTRTKLLGPRAQTVDSVTASLARRYGASWSPGTASNALVLEWRGEEGETLRLPRRVRFSIPRSEGDSLQDQWVVFTHHLTVEKTPGNPLGLAWTYAHAPEGLFRDLR